MRTLLVDHWDSFTFNLHHLVAEVTGVAPIVVRADGATWDELRGEGWDAVVLSPGPGRPDVAADFGLSRALLADQTAPPVLGVCLGHQGLALAHGGRVVHAPAPVHGRASRVRHGGVDLFEGLPDGFSAVRYHSLVVAEPLPDVLAPLAWTDDGVLLALRHRTLPRWGVQFHPESVGSEHGAALVARFVALARAARGSTAEASRTRTLPGRASVLPEPRPPRTSAGARARGLVLHARRLAGFRSPEDVYRALAADGRPSFWLDGSAPYAGERARSYVGGALGPLGRLLTYDAETRTLEVTDAHGKVERTGNGEPGHGGDGDLLDYLATSLARLGAPRLANADAERAAARFDLRFGFVGHLGYEMKAAVHPTARHRVAVPDARLWLADRLVAFDHDAREAFLLATATDDDPGREAAEAWLARTAAALERLPEARDEADGGEAGAASAAGEANEASARAAARAGLDVRFARPRARYLEDVAAALRAIRDGESYEVCLTTHARVTTLARPLDLFVALRETNPAPYAALLDFGDLALVSASPERFLRVGPDGLVEARPIKGTAPRGATETDDARLARELARSEKARAENLMITDLLRNDLGLVCATGSVHVPRFLEVERYATVHQLVSTVRGQLRPGLGAVDAIRAAFPPGSMTGAPKRRTLEILDGLEDEARGPYAGALGYLDASGTADLSVVIRTAVLQGGEASIGVGGAIVAQSDAEAELAEAELKAEALLRALARVHARGAVDSPGPSR